MCQYGYRYYTLGYTPILLYFPSSHVSSIGHWERFRLAPVPYPHRCFAFCLFVPTVLYILALQDAPDSSCILPVTGLESVISPGSPWSPLSIPLSLSHTILLSCSHIWLWSYFLFHSLMPSLSPSPHCSLSHILVLPFPSACVSVCVYFHSQRFIYLNTQCTLKQRNKKTWKVFFLTRKKPLGPRLLRVMSENS